jgi:ATP/maltotriose-dependent transcriptional regulator MalT
VDNPGIPAYKAAHALALVESGSDEEARDRLHRAIGERFADVHRDNLWLAGMNVWGDVAVQLDDPVAAATLATLLAPWREQIATTGASVLGPVAHSLGGLHRILGDLDRAAALLDESRLMCQQLDAPFFLARTNVELARVLRERGSSHDAERASALLHEAVQLAEAHGCALVERRARALRDGQA